MCKQTDTAFFSICFFSKGIHFSCKVIKIFTTCVFSETKKHYCWGELSKAIILYKNSLWLIFFCSRQAGRPLNFPFKSLVIWPLLFQVNKNTLHIYIFKYISQEQEWNLLQNLVTRLSKTIFVGFFLTKKVNIVI